ncbi:MAG: VOC family protein [Burkholderia sp.]|nr:VOC family protein [Burkholderia sp.]
MTIQKITPFLWYLNEAEEAAAFYTSIFPDSRVVRVTEVPSAGSTKVVDFVLFGQPFLAMSSSGKDPFNHSVSFLVNCADQAEIDRYWDAFLEGGGVPEACGWLKDRFGVSWQIAPNDVIGMMGAARSVQRNGRVVSHVQRVARHTMRRARTHILKSARLPTRVHHA